MTILMTILFIIMGYTLWQKWELTKFQVTSYQICSPKLEKPAVAAVIADLHGFSYGKGNQRLLAQIRGIKPQIILIAGDMLVSKYEQTYQTALETLAELVTIAPVYYSYGNHESRLRDPERVNHFLFQKYMEQVQNLGVNVLETESREISFGENQVMLSGLELELDYYEKGRLVPMEDSYMKEHLPDFRKGMFHILLAHNPAYAKNYAEWGADVTFCGHNHGGLIRIPGIGSIISPQFMLFPKYDAGDISFEDKHVIVSRGLGTHTFHVRIFNRAELLEVKFLPENS